MKLQSCTFFSSFLMFCCFIFREIWISYRSLQLMHKKSVYWRLKYELQNIQKRRQRVPKPAEPSNGSAGDLAVGPSSWGSHMIPLSNVIITCHRTFGGFRSFLPFRQTVGCAALCSSERGVMDVGRGRAQLGLVKSFRRLWLMSGDWKKKGQNSIKPYE